MLVNGDTLDEIDETFTVNLTDPTNATIADGIGLGTITDDDAPPGLSINDVTVTEGDTGTVNARLHRHASRRPRAARSPSTGRPPTAPRLARPTTRPSAASCRFAAGRDHASTVTVTVNGDLLDEANETFFVNLSSPTNATLADGQGLGTITDDDAAPDPRGRRRDGDRGRRRRHQRDLHGQPERRERPRRHRQLRDGERHRRRRRATTSRRSARSPSPPGQTTKTVTVVVHGDVLDEANETFFVNLAGPTNATLADSQGARDDHRRRPDAHALHRRRDGPRGQHGRRSTRSSPSTLSAPSGRSRDGRLRDGQRHRDRRRATTLATSSALTFNPGETTKTVTVTVNGDLLDEPNETFFLNLTNATNATLADGQAVGTITDDDGTPEIIDRRHARLRGQRVGRELHRHPERAERPDRHGRLRDGERHRDLSGGLHRGHRNAHLHAGPDLEADQRAGHQRPARRAGRRDVHVNLTNGQHATIVDAQAVGTITDNDALPALSIDDVTVDRGQRRSHDRRDLHRHPQRGRAGVT